MLIQSGMKGAGRKKKVPHRCEMWRKYNSGYLKEDRKASELSRVVREIAAYVSAGLRSSCPSLHRAL